MTFLPLALLPTLASLPVLPRPVTDALPQRLHAAHQLARTVQRLLLSTGRRFGAERTCRAHLLRDVLEVLANLPLEGVRVVDGPTTNHVLRELDLVAHASIANRVRCLADLSRGARLLTASFSRSTIRVVLQRLDALGQRVLLLADPADLLRALLRRRIRQPLHAFGNVLLAVLKLLRLLGELADSLVHRGGARPFQSIRGAAQLLQRRVALGRRAGRGALHRIRGLLHPLRRIAHLLRFLLARQALETTGLLLRLLRQLALRATTSAAAARLASQLLAHGLGHLLHALVLLLLTARELLQPLQRRIHLALR